MTNHETLSRPDAKFDEVVDGLLANGYQETDMQYNVARLEGETRTDRIDLVQPDSGDRLLVVLGSDEQSETTVREALGERAVLRLRGRSLDGVRTYAVPREAKLLSKILSVAPYRVDYMNKLQDKHQEVRKTLADLDPDEFGITDDSLVVVANGYNGLDDMHISIVPPLKPRSRINLDTKFSTAYDNNRYQLGDQSSEQSA